MRKKTVQFIAVEGGWGAQHHETASGPLVLKKNLNLSYQNTLSTKTPYNTVKKLSYEERLHEINALSLELMHAMSTSLQQGFFPVVIGGDDSMAIGAWSGTVLQLHAQQRFGLLWIDAHMDSHTPQTTPSMAIHGMPLAVLLGHGEKSLVELGGFAPKLAPEHVALIGTRSYEDGEAALLKKIGVKIYFNEEVHQRGFHTILQEAVDYITKDTLGFGVNLDLDVFDPKIMPGVGSPAPDGIKDLNDIAQSFQYLYEHPMLKALSISEYNPKFDDKNKSISLIKIILAPWKKHESF